MHRSFDQIPITFAQENKSPWKTLIQIHLQIIDTNISKCNQMSTKKQQNKIQSLSISLIQLADLLQPKEAPAPLLSSFNRGKKESIPRPGVQVRDDDVGGREPPLQRFRTGAGTEAIANRFSCRIVLVFLSRDKG